MAEIKQLQMNGVDILPVTHESAVVDNNGTAISAKYQPKSDSSLTTSTKTVVGAINEINNNKLDAGNQHSTVGSVKVRYMKYNGENFYPMTHTSAILDANGAVLSTTLSTLMTSINTTLPNKVSTLETNYNSVKSTSDNLKTTASNLLTSVGTLSSLNTTAKGNLVAAINEVFQLGNNARSRLAAALIAKGCTDITASSSLDEIFLVLESVEVYNNREGFTITSVAGASYGFAYDSSTGYWVSQNKGIHSSAALCQININNPNAKTVRIYFINYAESGYDFGIIGRIGQKLSTTTTVDSNVQFSCSNANKSTEQYVTFGNGKSGWFQVKYKKDGSANANNDTFQFRMAFV
jgi:hypothetical protein